jgi:phage terminase small subunit
MPKVNTPSGFTTKEDRFVREYMIDGNATRAAIAAGYSARSARVTAQNILKKPTILAAIEAGKKRITDKIELTAEKVLTDIARVASLAESSGEYSAALKGHELLGKHLKLFTEKHEVGGLGGGPVQFQITEKEADL